MTPEDRHAQHRRTTRLVSRPILAYRRARYPATASLRRSRAGRRAAGRPCLSALLCALPRPARTGLPARRGAAAGFGLVQYFEKARLEDHRAAGVAGLWRFMYGRLTVELMEQAPHVAVNGSDITYADIRWQSDPRLRVPPPAGFAGGTQGGPDGTFIPVDAGLGVAPGHIVPPYFWHYMNQATIFPGGWIHDLGLPLTPLIETTMVKQGETRPIWLQAFERNVLTFDPRNPAEWQVERGNLGTDLLRATGVLTGPPEIGEVPNKWIGVDLTRQWAYAYQDGQQVFDAPVSTGKDGWNTPPGEFAIYTKLPLQTMTGARNGESWEVPDVPHVMYFTGRRGAARHLLAQPVRHGRAAEPRLCQPAARQGRVALQLGTRGHPGGRLSLEVIEIPLDVSRSLCYLHVWSETANEHS